MYKRIFKLFIATVVFTLLNASCAKNDSPSYTLTTRADLKSSSVIGTDHGFTVMLFSTDNGITFTQFPILQVGKKCIVKILNNNSGKILKSTDFLSFDWSSSTPKPNDATSDTPEFTVSGSNNFTAIVDDKHCSFDASAWTGAWKGAEGTVKGTVSGTFNGTTDNVTISVDSATPNGFIMTNFFGDGPGVTIKFTMSQSTTAHDQIVTVPTQTTSDPGTASGTGTYDQCQGTFNINTTYTAFGETFTWLYKFTR